MKCPAKVQNVTTSPRAKGSRFVREFGSSSQTPLQLFPPFDVPATRCTFSCLQFREPLIVLQAVELLALPDVGTKLHIMGVCDCLTGAARLACACRRRRRVFVSASNSGCRLCRHVSFPGASLLLQTDAIVSLSGLNEPVLGLNASDANGDAAMRVANSWLSLAREERFGELWPRVMRLASGRHAVAGACHAVWVGLSRR